MRYNNSNGNFTAPTSGLYSFYFVYNANGTQEVYLYVDNTKVDTFR